MSDKSTDGEPELNMAALFASLGATAGSPTEPSADSRIQAAQLHDIGAGYIAAGFTSTEALYLLGQMLHGAALGGAIAGSLGGHGCDGCEHGDTDG